MINKWLQTEQAIKQWEAIAKRHQLKWFSQKGEAYRNILVDRRVGITRAMAIESYIVWLETGRKQVFVSSTVAQSEIFKRCILEFSGVERLPLGRHFRFMSPQMFCRETSGWLADEEYDLYLDGYLWMRDKDLSELLKSVAMSKPERQTFFSARVPDARYHLLEQVTEKVSGDLLANDH